MFDDNFTLVLVLAILVIIAIAIVFITVGGKKKSTLLKNSTVRDHDQIIKEANKRLASNPKDVKALKALGELHFNEGNYQKAFKIYGLLLDLVGLNSEVDEDLVNLRYGLSAMQCEAFDDAYKGLILAKDKNPELFEINASLGALEYQRKNYEKAFVYLKKAIQSKPDHFESLRLLGHTLFKLKKYMEASRFLKKIIAIQPDDKESLFALAKTHYETSQHEMALKIFTHLRPDPQWGPNAALFSGTIHLKKNALEKAILDFEIGLKHNIQNKELKKELLYRLASSYQNNLGKALELLRQIKKIDPNYKDVPKLITKYSELNSNRNLHIYMNSPIADFVTLCRRITTVIFPNAKIKVNDVQVYNNEYVDILAEIKSNKWEDVVLFRFNRQEGNLGELYVRDLYARSKEVHAGRGFYIAPSSFTSEARVFVEARLIDLVTKDDLVKLLKKVKSFQ